MAVTLALDHLVIAVNDLAIAQRNYAALGFTVVPGGEHKSLGSHNALISFADGSYLELIAFKHRSGPVGRIVHKQDRHDDLREERRSPVESRILPWESAGEGLVDFALLPMPTDEAMAAIRTRGLRLDGPYPGGRNRPDGQYVAWQFGVMDGYDLPFLCADVTPRSLRVPEGIAWEHANNVSGVAGLMIAVEKLDRSIERYQQLLGVPAREPSTGPPFDLKTAEFSLGSVTLTLAQPAEPRGPMYQQITRRGEGPYAVRLRTRPGAPEQRLDLASTHNVPMTLVSDPQSLRYDARKQFG